MFIGSYLVFTNNTQYLLETIVSNQFRFLFIVCQFGGKLVSLENIKPTPQQHQQPMAHVVHVSQVVTDTDFLNRSYQLQATLTARSFVEFCQRKTEAAQNEFEKTIWAFLKVKYCVQSNA